MSEVTLRELDLRFAGVDRRLEELKSAIEKLAAGTIREDRFTSTVHKVDALQKMVNDLDDRIDEAEGQLKLYRIIGTPLIGLLMVIAAAWLKQLLGL